ncbi:hypothetical protein NA57DRAFT_76487 [Rhizodiscina lignyota]|uniref:Uncharacterized protein n=1 Tax=Rhizodiscina lignyota TaxID=1504668 RepID=A0A9P4M4G0_9PEZI|nr:hypothetical protein NA57DRAFT_76487 [Rhizodiscina lignyota]
MFTQGLVSALALSGLAAAGPIARSMNIYARETDAAPKISKAAPLVPVKPQSASGVFLATQPNFDLTSSQSWQWGKSSGSSPAANVTGVAQKDSERYLSLENFEQAVQNVKCTGSAISFSFTNSKDYDSAKDSWNWVNTNGNTIYFVLNAPGCGTNDGDRNPYTATKATFGDNTVSFDAAEAKWADVLGNYEIHYGTSASAASSKTSLAQPSLSTGSATKNVVAIANNGNATVHDKRSFGIPTSIDGSTSVNFAHDLSGTIVPPKDIGGGVTLELDCAPCSTTGTLNLELDASLTGGIHAKISQTDPLGANINLKLAAKGALTNAVNDVFTIAQIPLDDIPPIAGIVDIGPIINFQANVAISEIDAEVDLTVGGSVSIDPSSTADINVLSPGDSTFSGWTPTFSANTPSIDGSVTVNGDVSPEVSLELDFTVLSKGLTAGIALIAPDLTVAASVAASTSGDGTVCGTDATAGASLEVGVQAQLDLFAGEKSGNLDQNNLPNKKQLFSTSTQLFSTCLTVGGSSATAAPPASTTTSAPAQSTPQVTITAFANSCCGGAFEADGISTCDTTNQQTQNINFVQNQCLSVSNPDGSGSLTTGSVGFTGFNTPDQNTCKITYFSDESCTQQVGLEFNSDNEICAQGLDFSDGGATARFFLMTCQSGGLPNTRRFRA